jgi:hypothetical protein
MEYQPGILNIPSPPFPSVSSAGNTQEVWEAETTCWREGGGGVEKGVGKGAEYYDRKKLWSSINHTILSACRIDED